MFQVGDLVSYRAEGVCSVDDIRTERFGAIGEVAEYYILSPLRDRKSFVYVPVANSQLCALMRPLLSAEEATALMRELRDKRLDWIAESRARNAFYRELLARGDRGELIVLVNTVQERIEEERRAGKRPTGTDENALRRATELLLSEFSVTCALKSEEELFSALRGEIELSSAGCL